MKKICIIGHYGKNKEFFDGQTIKTKILTKEIEKQCGCDRVFRIDTYGGIKSLPLQMLKLIKAAFVCESIIMLPARNGLKFYAPALAFLRSFFKRKVHYVVIGGWLPEYLKSHRSILSCLKKFNGIYAETAGMKKSLERHGLSNTYVIPNCKQLDIISENELHIDHSEPYKLCTFSRVMKEKGISDAVEAVIEANKRLNRTAFELDIYGQVDPEQTEWFNSLKNSFPNFIKYKGTIGHDKSTDVLKDHFALLFPTYYEGEGFAGTLIDAFASGLPVIASDWRYNPEIVDENTGILFEAKNTEALVMILMKLSEEPDILNVKRNNCLKKANELLPENALKFLINEVK